jgi:rubrerythrin
VETADFKIGNTKITLVDTPGFDDTNLSDTEVLTRLANWLKYTYDEDTLLSGLIYLHPLTEGRMYGASVKNITMFQKLCGEKNLGSVILGTTMWERVPNDQGEAREKELKETFWKEMLDNGSSVERVGNDDRSTQSSVNKLLHKHEIVLRLQEELASGKSLDQTDVGAIINAELNKLREEYQKKMENALSEERDKWKKRLANVAQEKMRLRTEKIARLPRQTRRWWQLSWRCLRGCGPKSRNDGVWQCPDCHQEQYNVRY